MAMTSGAVERYLLAFNDAMVAGAERRERIVAEVEAHLRDATEALIATGMTPDAAEHEAVARFGEPAAAAERFGPDPLGRVEQALRWYDARRIARPVLVPLVALSPFAALGLWATGKLPLLVVILLCVQITTNLQDRNARAPGALPSTLEALTRSRRLRLLIRGLVTVLYAGVIAYTVVLLNGILGHAAEWIQVIFWTYALCGAAVYSARLRPCRDPGCLRCRRRWAARHEATAAGMRYAAWTAAIVLPALAAMLPGTAGHEAMALLFLMIFVALAPAPTRTSQQWLRRRRPAAQVAARSTPLLALLVVTARNPLDLIVPLGFVGVLAVVATGLEIRRSRARGEATRRRLVERTHGIAGEGAAG